MHRAACTSYRHRESPGRHGTEGGTAGRTRSELESRAGRRPYRDFGGWTRWRDNESSARDWAAQSNSGANPAAGATSWGPERDFQALCTVDALVAHAARLASARQSDDVRDRERSALVSYFRDIAAIPTLTKDHEVLLAKEIEASTRAFREGMRSIPLTAREVVGDLARAQGRRARDRQDVGVVRLGLAGRRRSDRARRRRALEGRGAAAPARRPRVGRQAHRREGSRQDAGAARPQARASASKRPTSRCRSSAASACRLLEVRREAQRAQRDAAPGRVAPQRARRVGRAERRAGARRRARDEDRHRPRDLPAPHGADRGLVAPADGGEEHLRPAQPEAGRRDRQGLPQHGDHLPGPDPGREPRA